MSADTPTKSTELDNHSLEEIDEWLKRYPPDQKQSAVLAALRAAQHQNDGFLTVELMDAVADKLEMSNIAVYEVASFYSMYETKPVSYTHLTLPTIYSV